MSTATGMVSAPRLRRGAVLLGGPAAVLVAWYVASTMFQEEQLFPGPAATAAAFGEQVASGALATDIMASLQRIALGFAIGVVAGAAIGLIAGQITVVRYVLQPYIHFFRFISSMAWVGLAMLWLGIGETSKVALIAYTTIFIVIVTTMEGVAATPPVRLRAARCFGASPTRTFTRVVLPSTIPYIVTGARLAMGNSFATVAFAEMIAAESGVGYLIWISRAWLAVDDIFVGILVIGVLGLAADRLVVLVAKYALGRYTRPS